MRILCLLLCMLLPCAGFSQQKFESGTYVLKDGTKGAGQLKLDCAPGFKSELVVKSADKKKDTYSPQEVEHFSIGTQHFVPIYNFTLDTGLPLSPEYNIKQGFAEVVESGRVELLLYSFVTGNMKTHSTTTSQIGLIRRQGEQPVCFPPFPKKARPIISAYISDRPDLVARLNNEKMTADGLRTIIQAYNSTKE